MLTKLNPKPMLDRPTSSCNEDKEFQLFLEFARKCPYLFVDTETNGFAKDGFDIRDGRGWAMGLSIVAPMPGVGYFSYYFPFRHGTSNLHPSYREALKVLLEASVCVYHNSKFDLVSLGTLGINPRRKFYDTMLMAHWVNENLYSKELEALARIIGYPGKEKSDLFKQFVKLYGWGYLPPELMADYAAHDTEITWQVFEHFYPQFIEQGFDGELWEIEQQFILEVVIPMEGRGIRTDLELAEKEVERGERRMLEIRDEIKLNPGSTKDLRTLLIDQLKLPVVKLTDGGQPSMDKEAMKVYEEILERQNSPVAKRVLEYRGYQKTVSSNWRAYLELVSPDGRVRPNFKLHGTKTGRLSCEKPNLQQIPKVSDKEWNKYVKPGFIAKDGFTLWEADYSQLELRLGAAYAQEQSLIEVFADPNRDIFTEMSVVLGMSRFDTKTFVYSTQYGAGIKRISDVFGVSKQEAAGIRDDYFRAYPGFKKITDLAALRCRSQGYLKLWTGRRRHFQYPKSEDHKAFNSAMQGGAAEIVKRSMLRVVREADQNECGLLLQVHDSMVLEIENGKEEKYSELVTDIMADVKPDFGVKFKADWHRWGE